VKLDNHFLLPKDTSIKQYV